jgi:hypothetical protein
MPTRWAVGQAVLDHNPHRQIDHAVRVATARWRQIREVGAKVLATLRTVMLCAQFIAICRWLQLTYKDQLAPLENAPFSTPWAQKRSRVAQRFRQY